ncbi:MAG: hypothetical protein ACRDLL_11235 [Solirubrobacterales bacterium]
MIDRLRYLLDRPLDPLAARAMVVFATAILLGFGVLYVLGASEPGSPPVASPQAGAARPQSEHSLGALQPEAVRPAAPRESRRRQDPQDEESSPAAARAAKALRSHRALQHVPYRRGRFTVRLVGARGDRAVLAISAPTISTARRGWRRFLARYGDSGRSYIPRFAGRRPRATDG